MSERNTADEALLRYCLQKPGAYEDHPFGPNSTAIKVKGRIFAQFFQLKGERTATFNCDRITGMFYRDAYPGTVTRGWHCPPVQQPYFNTVNLESGIVPEDELHAMIDHAYKYVISKLTKKGRQSLQEETPPA